MPPLVPSPSKPASVPVIDDGLSGEAIPLVTRVTTIGDIFDAFTTARVYRRALSRKRAPGIMDEVRKGRWDGRLLAESKGVLETLPEDDSRLMRPA